MKRAALALLAFVFILGLQLILSVVIGWLSGASWKSCLDGFLMLLYLQAFIGAIAGVGYALMWIFGAIMFAISNGYCFKDFIGKYRSKDF